MLLVTPPVVSPDGEEEEDDVRKSMVSASPVLDRAFMRLVSFIYEQYSKPRPLSSPPLPLHCGFKNLFAVADLRVRPGRSSACTHTSWR